MDTILTIIFIPIWLLCIYFPFGLWKALENKGIDKQRSEGFDKIIINIRHVKESEDEDDNS